jgi:hypothetical protein
MADGIEWRSLDIEVITIEIHLALMTMGNETVIRPPVFVLSES